jgi:drug/metabolite transporter (DMT)-like permease
MVEIMSYSMSGIERGFISCIVKEAGARYKCLMGSFWVVLSSLGFATLGVFGKLAYREGFSREVMLLLRFLIALPCMALLVLLTRSRLRQRRNLWVSVGLGAVGIGIEASLFFLTLERLGASLTGIFLYLHPSFVAILSHFFLGERLTRLKAACLGLALAGSLLTVGVVGGAGQGMVSPLSDPLGLLYGVLTGGWYAVYILAGNRLTRDEDPLWVSFGVVAGSLLVFGILAAWSAKEGRATLGGVTATSVVSIGGLGVFATVIPFATLYLGMKKIGAVKASLISTLELVFTIALAAVWVDEKLTFEQLCGALLILISVLLTAARG